MRTVSPSRYARPMIQDARMNGPETGDAFPMLREAHTGPIAWTNDTLERDAGIVPITDDCREELLAIACLLEANPLPLVVLRPDCFDMPACRRMMRAARDTLDHGVGFVIIDRLPMDELSPESATQLYWLLGNMVASAVAQKWDGTMVYDVRDTGREMTPGNGVRASITNKGQQFHTDNSFNLPPEYVGLLCIGTAREGGLSGVVSFQTVHNRLLENSPELLERLYRPFWFDRQQEHAPDDPDKASSWPVFSYDGEQIQARFSTRLIYGGYQIADEPLDALGREAVGAVDSILDGPDMRRDFEFQPGQIQILNNRGLGHRRTGFRDWPEPERRRHMVRLWFRNSGRPFYGG